MPNRSVRKGKYLEDIVADILSRKWNIKCQRSQASGNFRYEHGADIRILKDNILWFPYIEVKNREDWSIDNLFRMNGNIWRWYEKNVDKALRVGGVPILVVSKKYTGIYVVMRLSDYNSLKISDIPIALMNSDKRCIIFEIDYIDHITSP